MSQVRTEEFECPKCHTKGQHEVWDSVNVDLNPELRDKVLSGEIFLYRCPHCGYELMLVYPLLYHDMKHKFMVFYDLPDSETGEFNDVEIPENPLGSTDGYTFRAVHSLDSLTEKIGILEMGWDDVAVERLKYMISHVDRPEMFADGLELMAVSFIPEDDEHKNGQMVLRVFDKNSGKEDGLAIDMEVYFMSKYACKFDPRMTVEDKCPCIDERWIESRLRKV